MTKRDQQLYVNWKAREFPGGPVVRTLRFTEEGTISILVEELGSHKLRGAAKKKKRERE